MATCLISLVEEIGKRIQNQFVDQFVSPLVEPHFNYWWCFDTNIQSLRGEVGHLDQKIRYLKQKIEEAGHVTENLRARVGEWLDLTSEKLAEGRRILQDDNIPRAWNITSRYSIGKRAKKTAGEIANLRKVGNFNMSPPMEFESRKSIEKNIVDCLNKSTVGIIVICGMGGVGKTTMAKTIMERVKEENLFKDVVMVTVSQTMDKPKIQNEIAELLDLKFDVETIPARANELRTRLMDTKRKIIILDDVWDSFKSSEDFELLGIPIESEMCKVLLTSRDANACKGIRSKEVFALKILEADEAWLLFKDKAGDCVEDVIDVAREVAAECKGLPLALVTVGLALQNITDICTWNHALSQLRTANPEDFSEVSRDVYNHLKLSYDFLENDKERYLFLLCCLFPEDFNISVEQLTWYSMGLELFTGDNNIKKARERTHTLVGRLESRSLLIDVEKEGKKGVVVKMHDVIRDVAIYIGSKVKHGFLKSLTSIQNSSDVNCNWMSVNISNEQMEVPVLSRFPKLRLLMLSSSNEFDDISHMSFEGVEDLNVLSFESISIPPSLGSLKNLQTLRLFRCKIENISFIGKLTSLKILSCCECEKIMELPAAIGNLKGLRLLELNKCDELKRTPFGIISSLSRLEELKILGSFSEWEWETGGEGRNASLTELNSLPNLTCLEIHISDCTLSALEIRQIRLEKLVRYRICINNADYFGDRDYEKVMILYLERDGAVGNWIRQLARNAESLTLIGDGSDKIDLAVMENLRYLSFRECSRVKKLVDTARTRLLQLEVLQIDGCESMEQVFWNVASDNNRDGCIDFSKLKELRLRNLPNLTAFCQGLENLIIKFPNLTELSIGGLPKLNSLFPLNSGTLENTLFCKEVSLGNLKSIIIERCCNLRCLFSVSAAGRYLLQLEDLRIEECESMEQVFWNDDNINGCIEFPKLKSLTLENLPNLTAICQGLENIIIKFPNLTKMYIRKLPKLNSLYPPNSKDDNLRYLFPASMARRCLLQLEYLSINGCESMEQVFWNEDRDDNTDGCIIEFPKLKALRLENLPNLTAFCQGLENIIINFPNLTLMKIGGLPKLNSLSPLNSDTLDHTTCSLHFVCYPKVEMGLLKVLTLYRFEDNIKNIWCHQIPNNFFNNLGRLDISFMNGIRSLMSTSIAKNLVRLKFLWIRECKEMVEVIGVDDDNDKQVVDMFPNLSEMRLNSLHKLIRFWQWNHALELPLLEHVYISNCPAMEIFTLGSINTPNIREISINSKNIEDHKDLNDVIRHVGTKSQRHKDENTGESKDEYDNDNVNKDKDDDVNVNKDEDDNERK